MHGESSLIPFRQLGQYEDSETGLYYNRFRYYSPETGTYISQDPIGLAGNNPNMYAYTFDSNSEVDLFGLDCSVAKLADEIPNKFKQLNMCKEFAASLKDLMMKNNLKGELIDVITNSNKGMSANIWSDKLGKNISTNGTHQAIKVGDTVFDNLNPKGIDFKKWTQDLFSPNGHTITGTGF